MGLMKANKRVAAPEFSFKRASGRLRNNGVNALRVAQAVFDTAGTDSAGVANTTVAAHGTGVYIPDNAVVVDAWIDVITTFTTAGADAGTIAVMVQGAGDVVAATAVSAAGDIWDAGLRGTKLNTFALDGNALTQVAMGAARAGAQIKLTAEREITVTVATQALTAGKMVINVLFFLGD